MGRLETLIDFGIMIVAVIVVSIIITCITSGCSKEDEKLEEFTEIVDSLSVELSEIDASSIQRQVRVYNFVSEWMIDENGTEWTFPTLCPITYNTVQIDNGIITIETDCSLTDGHFEGEVSNMFVTTDEIVVLGRTGVLSWPKLIEIRTCTEEQILLLHTRDDDSFFFLYE